MESCLSACDLSYAKETPQAHNLRLYIWSKRVRKPFLGFFNFLAYNGEKAYYLLIDETNFDRFQLRLLEDEKLYIVCDPNFDKDNQPRYDSEEDFAPRYSNLIALESLVRFEENDAGLHLEGFAHVRTLHREGSRERYIQSDRQLKINVLIQAGMYSEEFIKACKEYYYIEDNTSHGKSYSESKLQDAIMEVSPWDMRPYFQLLPEESPQLAGCKLYNCGDGSQYLKTMLTVFFRDARREFFLVRYMRCYCKDGNLSAHQDAVRDEDLKKTVKKNWAKYYVDRHMAGYQDWCNGVGDAEVIWLKNLALKKVDGGTVALTYTDYYGATKNLKTSIAYEGLVKDITGVELVN